MPHVMTSTMTLRLHGGAVRALRKRAKTLGMTSSELVRKLIEQDIGAFDEETTAYALTKRWVGAVRSDRVTDGRDARAALEEWNPDRRRG